MNLSYDHLDVQDAYQAELDNFIEGGKKRILKNQEFCGLSFQDFNTFWFAEYKQVNKEGECADGLSKTNCDMLKVAEKPGEKFDIESLSKSEIADFNYLFNMYKASFVDALDDFLKVHNRHRVIQGFQLYLENKQAA
ncbi:hypothetical protein [Salinivibrio kushneri]|uniref:hypothetical protein n=1 Tax=Salinivibrio kushneri TaxID=1908198 RepID=UPI00098980D0|nr:hypothetical protein [Salinivibrio kushneri]OOE71722.1 hypothetical protein BZG19_02075 [Salinivibrio kushneri]